MKVVGIVCSGADWGVLKKDKPMVFFMNSILRKNGIRLIRTNMLHYDVGSKTFSTYYEIDKNLDIIEKKESIKPDILWLKTNIGLEYMLDQLQGHSIIPDKKIAQMSNNKYLDYLFLSDFMPYTVILDDFLKDKTIQDRLGNKIVIKPINSNGGRGVQLLDKMELLSSSDKYLGLEKLFIVQQFLNFSDGYGDIIKGNHDIRLVFAGDEFLYSLLRIPKSGDFRSNISSGGSFSILSLDQVPQELVLLSSQIKNELKDYKNSIFSLDFAFSKEENKRFLIESNYSPGMWYSGNEGYRVDVFNKTSSFLKDIK